MRKHQTPKTKLKKGMKRLDRIAMLLVIATKSWRKERDDLWHYCSSCGMSYCHAFDGGDAYCELCPYLGCIKEEGEAVMCQACGNIRQYQ